MKRFKRHETSFTIATLWEFKSLGKINLNPKYQRSSNVWNIEKQSFLIDSVVKNFPIPPVFLHEFIDQKTGKTKYDVIDGKQRLTSIFKFIEGNLALPSDSSEDGYCTDDINATTFRDWSTKHLDDVKREFWQYQINIVFIDSEEEETINDVFDRLNRNGEPLSAQEFRNAMYSRYDLYKVLASLPKIHPFDKILTRLDANRFEDIEFCSELFFSIVEGKVVDSNRKQLDDLYKKYFIDNPLSQEVWNEYVDKFTGTALVLNELIGNMQMYYKNSVSHIYAMWMASYELYSEKEDGKKYEKAFCTFYSKVKDKDENVFIQRYIQSMQQSTKSMASRKNRCNALLEYLEQGVDTRITKVD